jgi:hypothetical protein
MDRHEPNRCVEIMICMVALMVIVIISVLNDDTKFEELYEYFDNNTFYIFRSILHIFIKPNVRCIYIHNDVLYIENCATIIE